MGLPHDEGVLVYGSGLVENVGDRHEGRFERDQRHGSACYIWSDGEAWVVSCQMDGCEQEGLMDKFRNGVKGEKSTDQNRTPRGLLR